MNGHQLVATCFGCGEQIGTMPEMTMQRMGQILCAACIKEDKAGQVDMKIATTAEHLARMSKDLAALATKLVSVAERYK